MVEPPGTAPGSDPLIPSAFMSIVPKDRGKIGAKGRACKGCGGHATLARQGGRVASLGLDRAADLPPRNQTGDFR